MAELHEGVLHDQAKFGPSMSNGTSVPMVMRLEMDARVTPFGVTQGHWNQRLPMTSLDEE